MSPPNAEILYLSTFKTEKFYQWKPLPMVEVEDILLLKDIHHI